LNGAKKKKGHFRYEKGTRSRLPEENQMTGKKRKGGPKDRNEKRTTWPDWPDKGRSFAYESKKKRKKKKGSQRSSV